MQVNGCNVQNVTVGSARTIESTLASLAVTTSAYRTNPEGARC